MTNCSLITNQTFDVKNTKHGFNLNNENINDFDNCYSKIGRDELFPNRKKPLLSQNEIDDFFVEHEDSSQMSVPSAFVSGDRIKISNSSKSYLASKHISLKTLFIIILSFLCGAVIAGFSTVGYYNLKSSIQTSDEKLPVIETSLEKNQIMIEGVKSRVDELSMKIDAVSNHLMQSEKLKKIE